VQSGVDRGRTLAALDMELTGICQPARTGKRDFTQTPSVDLGTNIFWTVPQLGRLREAMALETKRFPEGASQCGSNEEPCLKCSSLPR
jgi:hypothetical protein